MNLIQLELPQQSPPKESILKKIGLAVFALGMLVFFAGATGAFESIPLLYCIGSIGLATLGGILFILPSRTDGFPGIKNNGVMFRSASNRGMLAWVTAVFLTGFYILLYWGPPLSTISLLICAVSSVKCLRSWFLLINGLRSFFLIEFGPISSSTLKPSFSNSSKSLSPKSSILGGSGIFSLIRLLFSRYFFVLALLFGGFTGIFSSGICSLSLLIESKLILFIYKLSYTNLRRLKL